MRNSKHGLKALGLVVMAALGMMAFSAVGAQAQTLLYNLATPAGGAINASQLGTGYLLVAARDLKIECGELEALIGSEITAAKHGVARILFKKCVAKSHAGVPIANCGFKVLEHVTADALVLPILHVGVRYLLFEPLNLGPTFTVVSFKSAAEGCALPLNNPVSGSVVAKVLGSELDATTQTIEFSQTIQLLIGDVLKYGSLNNTSYLNGTVDVEGASGAKIGFH